MKDAKLLILCLAAAVMVAGCGGKETVAAEDVEAQAHEDLRNQVIETIEDPRRTEAALAALGMMVDEYVTMRESIAERRKNLRRLNADYDATREQFLEALDRYDEQVRVQRKVVSGNVRAFRASLTDEEWAELVKFNTRTMKQFMRMLENA